MPFFHLTYSRHVPSILKHGLGGNITERNFWDAQPGTYLARDVETAFAMLFEHWVEILGAETPPKDWIKDLRLIVIDDSRVKPEHLYPDPSLPTVAESRLYSRVIVVTGMPILDMDQIQPPEYRPGGSMFEELRHLVEDDPMGVPPPGGGLVREPGA